MQPTDPTDPTTQPPKPARRSVRQRALVVTERMLLRQLRAVERRGKRAGRRKKPPKEIAILRATAGRIRAITLEGCDD